MKGSLLPCAGFSLQWLLLLWSTGFRHASFFGLHGPSCHVAWESSQSRKWTCVPWIGRWTLNHWNTREFCVCVCVCERERERHWECWAYRNGPGCHPSDHFQQDRTSHRAPNLLHKEWEFSVFEKQSLNRRAGLWSRETVSHPSPGCSLASFWAHVRVPSTAPNCACPSSAMLHRAARSWASPQTGKGWFNPLMQV